MDHLTTSDPDCAWPSTVPSDVKEFFASFNRLLGSHDSEHCRAWGNHFAPDGEMEAFGEIFKGPDATAAYAAHFRTFFGSFKQIPLKAYVHDDAAKDLIITYQWYATCADGSAISGKSAAHYVLLNKDGKLFVQHLAVYLDPNPLTNAMKNSDPSGPSSSD